MLSLNTLSAKVCPCKHTTIKSSRTDWMCLGDALEIALGFSLEIEFVIDGLFSLSTKFFSLVLGFNEGCKRCLVYTISHCHARGKRIFSVCKPSKNGSTKCRTQRLGAGDKGRKILYLSNFSFSTLL